MDFSVESETSCMQARESASRDMLSVKDAQIAALCTELRGKDRMLQAKTRVCTPPYYSHLNTLVVECNILSLPTYVILQYFTMTIP